MDLPIFQFIISLQFLYLGFCALLSRTLLQLYLSNFCFHFNAHILISQNSMLLFTWHLIHILSVRYFLLSVWVANLSRKGFPSFCLGLISSLWPAFVCWVVWASPFRLLHRSYKPWLFSLILERGTEDLSGSSENVGKGQAWALEKGDLAGLYRPLPT
jgi:hypothetical protein